MRMSRIVLIIIGMMVIAGCGKNQEGEMEAIDLGLSVKWANMNIGAKHPSDCGFRFAWGECEAKEMFSPENYEWQSAKRDYVIARGVIDKTDNLTPSFDVATIKCGGNWTMPSRSEIEELIDKCLWKWTEVEGTHGYQVIGPNGKSIFLPVANDNDSIEYYWQSTVRDFDNKKAYNLCISDNEIQKGLSDLHLGHLVRPVMDKHEWVDLGLSTKWASCNIGANVPYENGDYYSWGETETKHNYDKSKWDKYNIRYLNILDVIDSNGNLTAKYDVARQKWGRRWRMPKASEFKELIEKCTWENHVIESDEHNYYVYKVTGPNGNFIYLPFSGRHFGSYDDGYYWASEADSYENGASILMFGVGTSPMVSGYTRATGMPVRAVYSR